MSRPETARAATLERIAVRAFEIYCARQYDRALNDWYAAIRALEAEDAASASPPRGAV